MIVYLFPKGAKFKYEFQKGKPWQYSTLYSPFDFSVLKSSTELEAEKKAILDSQFFYFRVDTTVYESVKKSYVLQFSNFFSLPASSKQYYDLYDFGISLLDHIYSKGVLPLELVKKGGESVFLINGNVESTIDKDQFANIEALKEIIDQLLQKTPYLSYRSSFYNLFLEIVQPNITLDQKFTSNALSQSFSDISLLSLIHI